MANAAATVLGRGSLTIAAIRDGDPAVTYVLLPDVESVTKKLDGTLSASQVSCSVYKVTGNAAYALSGDHMLTYLRTPDGASDILAHTSGTSDPVDVLADTESIEFELSDGNGEVIDRVRVPVLSDATDVNNALDSYSYLRDALEKQGTTVQDGLVLSSLVALGYTDDAGVRHTMAGINGLYIPALGGRTIASWWGGDMLDRFDAQDNRLNEAGKNYATALTRMDGSAYFAGGNVGFKANGEAWFGGQNGLQIDEFGNITIGSGVKINLSDGEKGIIESLQSLTNFHIGLTRLLAPCNANNEEISWQEAFQHDGTSDPDAIMAKSLKAKVGLWSTGFLSAIGLNDSAGSGAGSAYDRLDSWNAYTEDKAGYVLSAALGHDLYTGKADVSALGALTSRVSVLESKNYLSDLVLSQSGSGNAVTNVALSADKKTLTVTKGATYALSSALSNYVTLDTEQTISKRKKFLTDIEFPRSTVEMRGGKAIGITWNDRDQGNTAQTIQVGAMTNEDAEGNITQRYLYLGWGIYPYSLGQNFAVCKDFIKYKNLDVLHAGNYAAVLGNVYQAKGDYVTLNTIQNITARKQFNSVVIFNRPIAEYQPAFLINKVGDYFFGIGGTTTANEIQLGHADGSYGWANDDSLKIRVRGSVTASQFIKSGGTPSQFLKADGSVDSNSYALSSALSNYYTKVETNSWFLHTGDAMKYAGSLYGNNSAAAYKITTTWTKADGNGMPTINIRGYAYGANSAIDIDIVSYQHSNQYWSIGAVSKGSWRPENIYLTAENGKTVIYLVPDNTLYMGQLHVFVYRGFNITRQQMEGWTIEALSAKPTITSDMQLVPWRAISGSIDNAANLGGIAASEYITKSNYPSVLDSRYLQSSTAASTYVKKSGDTMTGPLKIESGNDLKIILNNTDSEAKYQQIAFQQNGVEYGKLGTNGTDHLQWNGYKIWHAGNDGSGSGLDADLLDGKHATDFLLRSGGIMANTNVVTNLNADLLDGAHADDIRKSVLAFKTFTGTDTTGGYDLNTLAPDGGIVSNYGAGSYWANAPASSGCGIALHIRGEGNLGGQLFADINHNSATDVTRNLWWRASGTVNDAKTWGKWHQIAFTDSNVDSATKLQNSRTLWGKPFNGTGNVSGDMINVGSINAIIGSISGGGAARLHIKGVPINTGYDYIHLYVDGNGNNARPLVLQDGYGNVGVGMPTPAYKLDVNGTARVSELKIGSITIKEDTANGGLHIVGGGLYTDRYLSALGINPDDGTGGGADALSELLDVQLASPASGQALVYNGTHWVNSTLQTGLNTSELASYLTSNNYARKSDIPSLEGYATQTWVEGKGYLTAHQPLTDYLKKTDAASLYQPKGNYILAEAAVAAFVSAIGTNGNLLTWTKNGATHNITVPYATSAASAAMAAQLSDMTAYTAWGQPFFTGGKPKSISGALTGVTTLNASGRITAGGITSKADNDLVGHSNEMTFIPQGFAAELWLNYRTASGATDGSLNRYVFGNGGAARAGIDCKFISLNNGANQITWDSTAVAYALNANLRVAGDIVAQRLSLNGGSNPIEWDAENNAYKVNGNLYATGFLSALGFSYISATEVAVDSMEMKDAKFTVEGTEVYVTFGSAKYKLVKTAV